MNIRDKFIFCAFLSGGSLAILLFGHLLLSERARPDPIPSRAPLTSLLPYTGRFYQDPRLKALAAKIPEIRSEAVARINERLGLDYVDQGTILIRLHDAYNPFTASRIQQEVTTARAQPKVDGKVVMEFKVEFFISGTLDFETILVHEMTHAVLRDLLTEEAFSKLPRWLDEGIAMYVAGQGERDIRECMALKRRDPEGIIDGLEDCDDKEDYCEAYLAVKYLVDTYGPRKLQEFVDELVEGSSWEEVFARVFREDSESFRNNARSFAMNEIRSLQGKGMNLLLRIWEELDKTGYSEDTSRKIIADVEEFLRRHPDDPLVPDISLYYYSALVMLDEYEKAAAHLTETLERFLGRNRRVSDLLLSLGRCRFQLERYRDAAECFRKVYSEHPDTERLDLVLYYSGASLYKCGEKAAADRDWRLLVRSFPESDYAKDALEEIESHETTDRRHGDMDKLPDAHRLGRSR